MQIIQPNLNQGGKSDTSSTSVLPEVQCKYLGVPGSTVGVWALVLPLFPPGYDAEFYFYFLTYFIALLLPYVCVATFTDIFKKFNRNTVKWMAAQFSRRNNSGHHLMLKSVFIDFYSVFWHCKRKASYDTNSSHYL